MPVIEGIKPGKTSVLQMSNITIGKGAASWSFRV